MLYELARALIQRIIRDKVIMGLLIILGLGFFMGGLNSHKEESVQTARADASGPSEQAAPKQSEIQALEPKLATDFVTWWLSGAMDYSANLSAENHKQAFAWMTPDAQAAFEAALWPPGMSDAIVSGKLVAAFHLVSVQAAAINPDGSVVVGVNGTLVTDTGGQPVTHQVTSDFLVRRSSDGLRVAGVYNRVVPLPGPSVY
jgi:hypothetical protein